MKGRTSTVDRFRFGPRRRRCLFNSRRFPSRHAALLCFPNRFARKQRFVQPGLCALRFGQLPRKYREAMPSSDPASVEARLVSYTQKSRSDALHRPRVGGGQTGQLHTKIAKRRPSSDPGRCGLRFSSQTLPNGPQYHKVQSSQHKSYPSKTAIPHEPGPLDSYTTKQSRKPIDCSQPPR